jgi:hypothetical protein
LTDRVGVLFGRGHREVDIPRASAVTGFEPQSVPGAYFGVFDAADGAVLRIDAIAAWIGQPSLTCAAGLGQHTFGRER